MNFNKKCIDLPLLHITTAQRLPKVLSVPICGTPLASRVLGWPKAYEQNFSTKYILLLLDIKINFKLGCNKPPFGLVTFPLVVLGDTANGCSINNTRRNFFDGTQIQSEFNNANHYLDKNVAISSQSQQKAYH